MRRNPTQSQSAVVVNGAGKRECTEPAKACTLELSATEKDNGKGTGGSDAAGHQPANFITRPRRLPGLLHIPGEAHKRCDDGAGTDRAAGHHHRPCRLGGRRTVIPTSFHSK